MSEHRLALSRCGLGALIMLWSGVVIGVSFLAAPAKFSAPTLSLPVALDVGRQEFRMFNLAEVALSVVALALAAHARVERTIWFGLAIALGAVILQALWLLPVLEARAEMIIQGETPPSAPWHTLYIAVEVLKLLSLLVIGWLALWRPR
jgi:hypothetical protein